MKGSRPLENSAHIPPAGIAESKWRRAFLLLILGPEDFHHQRHLLGRRANDGWRWHHPELYERSPVVSSKDSQQAAVPEAARQHYPLFGWVDRHSAPLATDQHRAELQESTVGGRVCGGGRIAWCCFKCHQMMIFWSRSLSLASTSGDLETNLRQTAPQPRLGRRDDSS